MKSFIKFLGICLSFWVVGGVIEAEPLYVSIPLIVVFFLWLLKEVPQA